MAKIVLISCVSKKLSCKSKAKDLYISSLFKFNLKYADSFFPDNIFILSAKYGLVSLDDIIDPYDMTLNNMNSKEIKLWADNVLVNLSNIADLKTDEFIFLAGDNYRKYLISSINNYKIPLKGLGIGKQLHYLKEKTKNV